MSTNYPSQREVQAHMLPELLKIQAESDYAAFAEASTPPINYRAIVGERHGASHQEPTVTRREHNESVARTPGLFADHLAFLNEVAKHPSASIVEHYRNLKWSSGRGDRIKAQLLEVELISSDRHGSGNGRPREILKLNASAISLLNEKHAT